MSSNDALVLVLSRNAFYKRLHILALGALGLNIVIIIMLSCALAYLLKNPAKPLYFAADEVGRMIQIVPVNIPNMTTEAVTAWTVNAVQSAYSYDYINYRAQLQSSEKYFTNYGWNAYMKALGLSGNLRGLTSRQQVVLAQVIAPPKLLRQALLGGALAWQFEMPLLVIYTMPPYDGSNQFSNAWIVTATVQRQPILQGDNGLGIVQLISRVPTADSSKLLLPT
jgi:intracellular multiplication protein IcmL